MEFIVVLAAAARFRRAWLAESSFPEPLSLPDPRVVEANESVRELMEATETTDLFATFDALGELLRQTS